MDTYGQIGLISILAIETGDAQSARSLTCQVPGNSVGRQHTRGVDMGREAGREGLWLVTYGRRHSEAAAWVRKGDRRVNEVYVSRESIGNRVTGGADDLLASRSMRVDRKLGIQELIG